MGYIIKKKMNGMSWWMKTSIVLLLTMATSVFMYKGWYNPVPAQAATVIYQVSVPSTASVGIDGSANLSATGSIATAPTVRGEMLSTLTTSASSYRPTSGMTSGTATTLMKLYSPVYATAQTITAPVGNFAIRGYNASDTWTFHIYSYNPSGAAGNKTLMYSSNTTTSGTGSTVAVSPTYTLVNSLMPAGYRLMTEIVYTPGGTTYTPRLYLDGTSNTSQCRLTVTETAAVSDSTAPFAGTISISPDISSAYTSAAPTITTLFTDAESAVTACEYTTNGGANWLTGVVSGASSPYTCTANPTGLTGFLNINMRATSTGGTTTATQIQRTVDTSVPTDGTLTVTAGNAQNAISWTAASDPGGSGIASYILRFNTGATATAPVDCTTGTAVPGSPFTAATLSTLHTGLTNGNQYAYRLCATDNLTNRSGGVTKTVTPGTGPVTTIANCAGCHGYSAASGFTDGTARNTPAGQFQGSHSVHPNACSTCHTAPATTTSSDFNHANTTVNMAPSINGGSYVKGSAAVSNTFSPSTCNNTTCHGGASPTWGSATTQASCTKCHGVNGTLPAAYSADTKTAAPGYNAAGRDTGGATVATDAQVGAHDTHLRALNAITNPIACTECHSSVNATSPSFAGHMDGAGTVSFGALATTGGAAASYSAGTCSTTYCHYGKPNGAYTVGTPVAWTNTALLTGTPTLAGDCSKCHASPPSTTGDHAGVTNINQCNGCHDHVTTAGTFSDPSKHINGTVEAASCSACHGWPPTTNAHTVHIDNIIAEKSLGGLPGGFVDNQVCGTCHNVSSTTKHAGSAGSDGTSRNILAPTPSILQAENQFGASAVSYDKASTTTCSNISCHFGTSTAWGTPTSVSCKVCHGYPPVTTVGDPDNKHVAGATAVNHIGTGATVNTKETFVS
ncbi:MAG TPA: hypothetical protein HPP94_15825, partial [Desulfuromonadales bacterium]|nr:hypothetical protein [Desulfuromonadales bacterium]